MYTLNLYLKPGVNMLQYHTGISLNQEKAYIEVIFWMNQGEDENNS